MAEARTQAAPAALCAPAAPVAPPPDRRLVAAAGRLGGFYTALKKRRPSAGGLELLPGDRKGGSCVVQIGLGASAAGRTIDYAAALVLVYGPYVVGAWEQSGAQTVIQGWIIDYENAAQGFERDPSTGLGPARYHSVNTTGFRDDFDAVIGAVDAAGPRVVASLLDGLGGVLGRIRLTITPQWCAIINRRLAPLRARLFETVPSAKHMREDPYEEYRFRGAAARAEFGPEVSAIRDPLLLTLFEHPDGIDVLRELARSADGGGGAARAVISTAELALQEFRKGLGADVHWRYLEFLPTVLERLGLAKIPGLADYLTAIGDTFVRRSDLEKAVEVEGLALFVLGLMFSGGISAVLLAAAGVGVAGLGLGLAFLDDRQRALAAQAYAFERGEKRLIQPRFPVRTALAAAALLLAAIGFYFSVRGLGKVPQPRPGAPAAAPAKPPTRGPLDMKAKGIAGSDASAGRTSGVATGGDAAAGETARSPRPTPSLTQGAAQAPPTDLRQATQPLPQANQGSKAPLQEGGPSSPAMAKPLDEPSASARPRPDERLTDRPRSPRDSPEVGARLVERPNTPPKRELPPYPENQYRGAGFGGSARVREVPIGGSEEATMAHEGRLRLMRQGAIDYNENIAVVRYRNPRTKRIEFAWAKSNADEHAERVLESWLKAEFGPDYNPGIIEKLYTERIPCGAESRNCYAWMRSDLYNAEIEYSFATHTIPATPTTPARTIDANQELKSFYFRNFNEKGIQRFRE